MCPLSTPGARGGTICTGPLVLDHHKSAKTEPGERAGAELSLEAEHPSPAPPHVSGSPTPAAGFHTRRRNAPHQRPHPRPTAEEWGVFTLWLRNTSGPFRSVTGNAQLGDAEGFAHSVAP